MSSDKRNPFFKLFQWLVFKAGDTRWLGWKRFPFIVTWDVHSHEIDLNEVINDAMPKLEPGDIILHRDDGFLSNIAIGGAMTHAGLYVGKGQVIEALSDGVVKRSAAHILYSDRACILRPKLEDRESCAKFACDWAERLIGFPYDIMFDFNGEAERELITAKGHEAIKDGVRFCCTEIPYFCYLEQIRKLDVYRRKNVSALTRFISVFGLHPGTLVIDADMYVTAEFDMVWCSKKYTVEWAKSMGCSEQYQYRLEDYWSKAANAIR